VDCNLAIYDNEAEYANQLMEYMKRKQSLMKQIRVFTNELSLKEYLEHNTITILLMNETLKVEEIKHENIKNICTLSENNKEPLYHEYPTIYKFQSADSIIQNLFSLYPGILKSNRPNIESNQNVKIVCFFSLTNDIYRQVLALSFAKHYSDKKKTLYINLDLFQALPKMLNQMAEKGLSEFIYYLKQHTPNLHKKMKALVTSIDQLDYLQGVSFGTDIYEITGEDMQDWISELKTISEYEVIVFDMGNYYPSTMELFKESNQIVFSLGESKWEKAKYDNFVEQFNWARLEDILEKIHIITIPAKEQIKLSNISPYEIIEDGYKGIFETYMKDLS
jgi:hypothetical protein